MQRGMNEWSGAPRAWPALGLTARHPECLMLTAEHVSCTSPLYTKSFQQQSCLNHHFLDLFSSFKAIHNENESI